MAKEKKISIIIFPGSNCDRDLFVAVEKCLGIKPEYIWHNCSHIKTTDMILIPGGFSFGDYLRTGAIASKSPIINSIIKFANSGRFVLGICNGFQILCETGLLPGVLLRNISTKFVCKNQILKVCNSNTSFSISVQDAIATFYENQSDTIGFRTNDQYKTLNTRQLNHIRFNDLAGGVFGFEIQNRNLDYDFLLNAVESKNNVSITNLSSFFTMQSILLNKALVSIGCRVNWNSYEKDISIAPRLNIDLSLNKFWGNVIFNSGRYFQNPPEKYLSVVNHNDLKSVNTFQHSLTFEKLITRSTKFSISIYEKQYSNAPMMERNQMFVDPTFLLDELRTYLNIISSGKAETSGVEILLEKKRAINFYGLIGGSIYNSTYNDQQGVERSRNNNYEYLLFHLKI